MAVSSLLKREHRGYSPGPCEIRDSLPALLAAMYPGLAFFSLGTHRTMITSPADTPIPPGHGAMYVCALAGIPSILQEDGCGATAAITLCLLDTAHESVAYHDCCPGAGILWVDALRFRRCQLLLWPAAQFRIGFSYVPSWSRLWLLPALQPSWSRWPIGPPLPTLLLALETCRTVFKAVADGPTAVLSVRSAINSSHKPAGRQMLLWPTSSLPRPSRSCSSGRA